MNRQSFRLIIIAVLVLAVGLFSGLALARAEERFLQPAAVGTAFTYQGQLDDGGSPANGSYDFEFGLYDSQTVGSQVGVTQTLSSVNVSGGLFTVMLDFGSNAFTGGPRFLAIQVRAAGGGTYTALTPRQAISPVPYAIYADTTVWGGIANIPAGFADGVDNTGASLANVVTVARSGGDYTSVQAALDSIGDASAENPYLVQIGPGIYTGTVNLKSHVDIEGSGEGATILRGLGSNTDPFSDSSSATLQASGNISAEVRFLTVESVGTGQSYATAIWAKNVSAGYLKLTQLTATAAGGSANNYGVYNFASSPVMSQISATASGGTESTGVRNYSSSTPAMNNVTATASGATTNTGISNSSSSPLINHVVAAASGGTTNTGVQNFQSSPTINNLVATGDPAVNSYGMSNLTSSSPVIWDSSLKGNYSIFNVASSSATVATTILDGPVNSDTTCLDSRNGFGAALDTTCQVISGGDAVTWGDVANIPAGFADGVDNVGVDPANIVWVATSGGDYTSVSAALESISDASANNPYLIKVAPGIYTGTVSLKAYVDIEGSGEGVTILRGLGGGTFSGTVNANGIIPAEVRSLSIESITSAAVSIGIKADSTDPSLKFTHVTVMASGGTGNSYGIYNYIASPTLTNVSLTATGPGNARGIFNQSGSSPTLFNVSAMASGGTVNVGIFNYTDSSPLMTNVTASAGAGTTSYGMNNQFGSAPTVRVSSFSGVSTSIYNDGTSRVSYSAENVIWVAKSGGDFTSLSSALASITDASADNPYVIKIAPGVYSETTGVDLKAYVDIEGSGEGVTVLRGLGGTTAATIDGTSATLRATGVITGEVRLLTLESDGTGNANAVSIWTKDATNSLRFTHVSASAADGSTNYGIFNYGSSPIMTNLTVNAFGGTYDYGVYNYSYSSPNMNYVSATGAGGSNINIGVANELFSSPIMSNISATASGGTNNYGIKNYNNSSPMMNNVSATASGGSNASWGVNNGVSSAPVMNGVTAIAFDGGNNLGIENFTSSPKMENIIATGTGGTHSYGVYNNTSSPDMNNVTASASGGSTANYGIWNNGASPTIQDSALTGATNSIYNNGSTAKVSNTMLANTVTGGGFTCFNTYDASYVAYVCP